MLRKEKHHQSYSSILYTLIDEGLIPKDSKQIPLDFLQEEAKRIKEKKSNLSADMRKSILGIVMIDSIKRTQEAKAQVEANKPTEEIVMAGGN